MTNGAAPEWMARRLLAIGQKPISALVDITNYVMIDLGRPLHVYDRAKLSGALVARKARVGESVLALNGKTYTLDASMTVIADDAHVHDIGGIMGGEESGVSETTTDVLIECAYFDPDAIARTGQKLALTSDARARFERGVDPAFPRRGAGDRDAAGDRHLRRDAERGDARRHAADRSRARLRMIRRVPKASAGSRSMRGGRRRSSNASASRCRMRGRCACRAGAAISTGRPIWSRK